MIRNKEIEFNPNDSSEFEKFFDLSLNMLCIAGTDAKFKKVNPKFMEVLGYNEEELLSIPFIELIHPDDIQSTIDAVKMLDEGLDVVDFENRYIAKDGSIKNIKWAAAPEGSTGRIYAVGTDITEKKKEEFYNAEIAKIRNFYISDINRSNDFWDKTLDLVLELTDSKYGFIGEIKNTQDGKRYLKTFSLTNIAWNEETRKLFEEKSKDGLEFHNLDTLFGEVIKTEKVLITNDPNSHPASSGRPDGHPPLDSFMGVPLHSGDKFIGMVGLANKEVGYDEKFFSGFSEIFKTISSLVNTYLLERELKVVGELSELYKDSMDKSAIISIADRDQNIIYVNELFENTFGYKSKDVLGKGHECIKSSRMSDEVYKDMWQSAEQGKQWHGEINNVDKDGKDLWMDLTVIPYLNQQNIIDQYVFIRRDITTEREQKKLEIAFQKAEESAKAKSEFLSMMSHEIRTPLNGVIGMTDLLQRTKLDREQQELIETIVHSGKTLLSIINDILDLSKIEAGKLSLEEKNCNLSDFLTQLIKPFRLSCEKKGLEFSFQSDEFSNGVYIDEARIGQVITNLCSNAIKFTESGKVSITLEKKSVVQGRVTEINMKVSDSGPGLSEDEKKLIFEPFSQLSNHNNKHEGTGLGLSITKKIVDAMGGVIKVDSQKGRGSCFNIQLFLKTGEPLKKINNRKILNLNDRDGQMAKRSKVLIAEDNPTNQIVIQKMIEGLGHNVFCVKNGEELLCVLSRDRFDLVLMDCQMPEMNGFDAAKKIRSSSAWYKSIPIVALTANAIKGDDQKCFDAGMNGYLSKPITRNELEREIKKYLTLEENLIDIERLTEFLESDIDGDLEIFNKTINTFLDTAPDQIKSIMESYTRDQFERIQFEVHSLKSSSAMVGAKVMSEICLRLEEILRSKEHSETGELILELQNVAFKSFESLRKHLPSMDIAS